MVVRAPPREQTVDLVGAVPTHSTGGGLCYRQPGRGELSPAVGACAEGLPPGPTLQRFLGELPEGLAGRSTSSGGYEHRAYQPSGALELHFAPAPGTFRKKDAFVFEERGHARDLLGPVLTRLQSALLKQHEVNHYRGWYGKFIGDPPAKAP